MKKIKSHIAICALLAVLMMTAPIDCFAVEVGDSIQCPICGSWDCKVTDIISPVSSVSHSYAVYTCNNPACGSNSEIPIHEYHQTDYAAPTCTSSGYVAYTCSKQFDSGTVCNESYSDYLAPLGHKEVKDEAVPATCTEDGLSEGSHCSVCSAVLKKQEVIKALGHKEEIVEAKDPTCVLDGHTEGKICSECQEELEGFEIIPALGHDWDEGKITKAATRDEEGIKTFTCLRCGETKTESVEKKTFPVTGVVIGGIGLIAVVGVVSAIIKASKIKKAFKLIKPALSRKNIYLVQDKDENSKELSKLFAAKRFLITENYNIDDCEDLPKDVKNSGPDLIIIEVDDDHNLDKAKALMEKIDAVKKGTYAITADIEKDEAVEAQLKQMAEDEKIIGYSGRIDSVKALIELILPIYKTEITFDGSIKSIGKIADLLGIDGVSKVTDLYGDGRSIVKTLKKDPSITNAASVIGTIASVMGWEKVEGVTDIIDQVDTQKGYAHEEIDRQKILNDYEDKPEDKNNNK